PKLLAKAEREKQNEWKHKPCGGATRKGTPCTANAIRENGRCRWHGALSTGPKTPEGRARVLEGYRQWQLRRRAEKFARREQEWQVARVAELSDDELRALLTDDELRG